MSVFETCVAELGGTSDVPGLLQCVSNAHESVSEHPSCGVFCSPPPPSRSSPTASPSPRTARSVLPCVMRSVRSLTTFSSSATWYSVAEFCICCRRCDHRSGHVLFDFCWVSGLTGDSFLLGRQGMLCRFPVCRNTDKLPLLVFSTLLRHYVENVSSLVFFMQLGFAMLCAGSIRAKNVKNVILW
jgi:hypothetical protein